MSPRFCVVLTVTAPAGAEAGPASTATFPHTLAGGVCGGGAAGVEVADDPARGVCAPSSSSLARRQAVTVAAATRTSAQTTTTGLRRYHARCSMVFLIGGGGRCFSFPGWGPHR